jgi:hypothetical protein
MGWLAAGSAKGESGVNVNPLERDDSHLTTA